MSNPVDAFGYDLIWKYAGQPTPVRNLKHADELYQEARKKGLYVNIRYTPTNDEIREMVDSNPEMMCRELYGFEMGDPRLNNGAGI